jgi:hypothetical protein
MHNKSKGAEFLFEHVTIHHCFYNEKYLFYRQAKDYFAVFLPIQYYLFISLIILVCGAAVGFLSERDHGLFFMTIAYLYYLMYEAMHFSFHAPEGHFLRKIPLMKTLSRFHLTHHQADLMQKYNFNISFPICDYLLGTVAKLPPKTMSSKEK